VPHARDHKALDSWILLLLHTHPYFNTKVETLLKKKVQNGHISLTLLKRSIAPYADILRDFFPNLLLWAQLLCRDAPNSSESAAFALSLYTHLFLWFEEPFCRQELLSTVMTHVGSGVAEEVSVALDSLHELVTHHHTAVRPFVGFIQSLLDYMDSVALSDVHIRMIYQIFCSLYYSDPLASEVYDDLDKLIKKQLSRSELRDKRMGIIGTIVLGCTLGARARQVVQLQHQSLASGSDADFEHFKDLMSNLSPVLNHTEDLCEFFCDELVTALTKNDIRADFITFIRETVQDDFTRSFLNSEDHTTVETEEIWFQRTPNVKLVLCIYPLAAAKDVVSRSRLQLLGAQFRLLQTCTRKIYNDSLDEIDSLLYCGIHLFKRLTLQEFAQCPISQQENMCVALFHTVNWFREVLNAFATQAAYREDVVTRVRDLIETEELLDNYLALCPTFVLNQQSALSKGKANTQLKNDKMGTEKLIENLAKTKCRLDFSHLSVISTFRHLDLSTHLILAYEHMSKISEMQKERLSAPQKYEPFHHASVVLYYLTKSFVEKLSYLLQCPKRRVVGNVQRAASPPSWLQPFPSKSECLATVKPLFAVLCIHLKRLVASLTSIDADDTVKETESVDDDGVYYLPTIQLILECFKRLLAFRAFYSGGATQTLFEEIAGLMVACVDTQMSPCNVVAPQQLSAERALEWAFNFFASFANFIHDFDTAKALLEVLAVIVETMNVNEQNAALCQRLSSIAGTFLSTTPWHSSSVTKRVTKHQNATENDTNAKNEFSKFKPEAVMFMLRYHIRLAENPLNTLENLLTKLTQFESENAPSFCTLNKSTFPHFYRVLLEELTHIFSQLGIPKVKKNVALNEENSRVIEAKILLLHRCVKIFQGLIRFTRTGIEGTQSRAVLSSCLRSGRYFVETFLQYIPWLTAHFVAYEKDILSVLEDLQIGTRIMQMICANSKVQQEGTLMPLVPPTKKVLEILIFKVKAMFSSNGIIEALSIGK
jgi:Fanconi anemia group D2 protein